MCWEGEADRGPCWNVISKYTGHGYNRTINNFMIVLSSHIIQDVPEATYEVKILGITCPKASEQVCLLAIEFMWLCSFHVLICSRDTPDTLGSDPHGPHRPYPSVGLCISLELNGTAWEHRSND